MTSAEFRQWRRNAGLTQTGAAEQLGISRKSVTDYEGEVRAVPQDVSDRIKISVAQRLTILEAAKEPEELPPPYVPDADSCGQDDSKPWLKLTQEERWRLPLGSPGWKYDHVSVLPRGVYYEVLDERDYAANGSYVSKIRWGSNGVGRPVMMLIGSTKGASAPSVPELGWVPPGAYRPLIDATMEPDTPNPKEGGGKKRAS